MEPEFTDFNVVMENRRKAIEQNIAPIGIEELKEIGETLFPLHDHPWREPYFTFLEENAASTFYRALTNDGINVIYCPSKEKGIWFKTGSGFGPMQSRGLAIMKEIVASR